MQPPVLLDNRRGSDPPVTSVLSGNGPKGLADRRGHPDLGAQVGELAAPGPA